MLSSSETRSQEEGSHICWQSYAMRASGMQACWDILLDMRGMRPADWTSGGRRVELMTSPARHAGSINMHRQHSMMPGGGLADRACLQLL